MGDEATIENENILLLKPKTNSLGIWGCTHIQKSRFLTYITHQYWIDLEKLEPGSYLKPVVDDALKKIYEKL
jgi:hypothetical protein